MTDHISSDIIDLPVDGMFSSADKKVISWQGENYYRACNELVAAYLPGGGQSFCTKRVGHPGHVHEDFDGRTRSTEPISFDGMELEGAVAQAIGAASMCWEKVHDAGIFDSARSNEIIEALIKRIRDAGPIYG